jgi:hypothetical protein
VITAHYPAEARNGRRHRRPPAETNGSIDQYDATVTCSSIAPPSDTALGWHPPWTTSPDANHDVNQCRNPYRTAVSKEDCLAHLAHNCCRAIKASEVGTNSRAENISLWNPQSFLSPQAEQWEPTITCLITSHSHRPSVGTQFDTDSAPVGIDNRCSVCMSHLKSDFVGELTETTLAVTGFHCTKQLQVFKGTMLWHIEDDAGIVHEVKIPNSYHVPKGNQRLLSPQHWAQQADGASCLTLNDRAILKWNDGKAVRTVPIDTQNVFTFDTAPGYRRFAVACLQANYIPSVHDHTPDTVLCTEDSSRRGPMQMQENAFDYLPDIEELEHTAKPSPINLNGANRTQTDQHITRATLDKQRREPTAELLRMHYKFGHVSFS